MLEIQPAYSQKIATSNHQKATGLEHPSPFSEGTISLIKGQVLHHLVVFDQIHRGVSKATQIGRVDLAVGTWIEQVQLIKPGIFVAAGRGASRQWNTRECQQGERQDLISLLLDDSRFDGDIILRQGCRSFQSNFVLLHLPGGDSNAIGIFAMEAFHE